MNKIVDSHKHFLVSCLCILASFLTFKIGYEMIEKKPLVRGKYTGERLGK